MTKLECPHCGRPGITMLRRMFLSPAFPAHCLECGGKVGVSYARTFLCAVPLPLGYLMIGYVRRSFTSTYWPVEFWLGGIAAMISMIVALIVPLQKR